MRAPVVEILSIEGCPNHDATRTLVEQTAAEVGVVPAIHERVVSDAEAAVRERFLGSPTVRVDGRDVEPGAESRTDYVYACRVYRTSAGLRGQPAAAWVREPLSARR